MHSSSNQTFGENNTCTVSGTVAPRENFTYSFTYSKEIESENVCQFFACRIDDSGAGRAISCGLYSVNCSLSRFCENTSDSEGKNINGGV